MRVFVSAFLLFVVACMPAPAQSVPAQDLRFAVGSGERRAVVVNQAPAGQLRPAVLVLHGGRGSADQQRERTGFDPVAQREGFTVVYPEGTALGVQALALLAVFSLNLPRVVVDRVGFTSC